MLSPASLRVCCLAVMAPALTKADRRADCLPVVLPEPFYFSKTADTFNSEDNNNHITFSKLDFKAAWQPSHRKSYMNRVWLRSSDRTKLVISNKIRSSASDIRKHWTVSSRIGLNVASKCKPWQHSKGFAALADKLRLKYTMNKNNLPNKNMGLAKANASLGLHDLKKMRKISQLHHKEDTTILESDGESSPDIQDSTNSDFHDETLVTVMSPVSKGILNKNQLSDHDCDVFSTSSSLDGLQLDSFSQTDSLRDIDKNRSKECQLLTSSEFELGSVATSTLQSNSVVSPVECNALADALDVKNGPDLSSAESCDTTNEVHCGSVDSQISSASMTRLLTENANGSEAVSYLPSGSSEADETSPNPLLCNFSNEIPLLLDSPNFLLNAPNNFCSENIANIYLLLSNQLLDLINWEKSFLHQKKQLKIQSTKACCNLTFNENENISKLISGKEEKLKLAILQFQLLKCKQMNVHVRKQIQDFVEYFQKKLGITCQVQVDQSHLRPEKDLVDIKAEILQSENVKSLSTAALVNLVRNIESNTIPDKLLPQQDSNVQNTDEPSDKSNVFDPEDFVDIKHTSRYLRRSLKKLLHSLDSDLTDESSDEESEHRAKFYEMPLDTYSFCQKKAIWNCLTESATLHSRSSWLIARIQELEYQLGMAKEKLKDTVNLDGDVCFEEVASCNSSTLSTTSIDIEQLSTKQTSLKKLIRPVNGCLDHNSVSDLTKVNCSLLESSVKLSSSLTKTEESCSRTRPLKMSFQKRKLVSVDPVPNLSNKVSKFSTVSCYCNSINVIQPCVLCAGRYNSTQSVDPDSMPLQDRIALLDPIFHPVLSLEKEIPMGLHFENTLKLTEAQYQTFQPVSPVNFRRMRFGDKPKHFSLLRNHSRKLNRYARSLLSVKYRNKHVQNAKHLRKHRLVFGKWRRLNRNKHSFHSRERIRRYSVVSSASSHDSPVPSPLSVFDDGSGLDYMKKKRDDDQFDIDDVILPLNSKIGRSIEILKYKDITCPSWRCEDKQGLDESEDIENISDAVFIRRHDRSEIEERKQLRSKPFGLNKRARRHRCDSRADSSGANTPDPVLLYNPDILFQVPSSLGTRPSSPALSPPTTPSSTAVISDDSQPSLGNGTTCSGFEKRKLFSQKRSLEENFFTRSTSIECDEVQPYAKRVYPLPDEDYELAVLASVYAQQEDADSQYSGPSCPASPESYTNSSSTSTVEEENDDDMADPEWTVHKNDPNSLVLKLSKR